MALASSRFAALKTGFGVPAGDFDGAVHSVFRSTVIIAVDPGSLLTLVPREAGTLPGGITIDAGAAETGLGRNVRAGLRAAVRAGILRIADGGPSVDLRKAEAWRSGLDRLSLARDGEKGRRAWESSAAILAKDGRSEKFAKLARESVSALIVATRSLNSEQTHAIIGRLVGLGEGGTPAGDDFLVGFTAGLHLLVDEGARRRFVEAFGDHLRGVSDRTNAVSRVYLEAAAAGEVSEKLTRLASSIAAGAQQEVIEATQAAIAVGHSSGADGVLGLLAGIAAWRTDDLCVEIDRFVGKATASVS